MARNSLALPDNLVQLLAAADQARGFPAGTMASLLQQESGGSLDRFTADPGFYHYPNGVAPNGKKSSARGLFGILDSTAKDPGYGVAPLKDWSPAEQVRFAADYLDARSKSAGSLSAGLAGYGEGAKYATQVERRRDGSSPAPATPAPVVAAAAPDVQPAALPPSVVPPPAPAVAGAPMDPEKDAWVQFTRLAQEEMSKRLNPDLTYGQATTTAPAPAAAPTPNADFLQLASMDVGNRPSFGVFQGLQRLGHRRAA